MEKEDIIVCNSTTPMPGNELAPSLELGAEYKIKDVYICGCGEKHLDIGLELKLNYVECYKCREQLPKDTHFAHISRFTKKDENV